ncbi:MAG: GNAT family N-acetyltransferase [Clostridia bacterium]|nr:GNAT family N-acetyltransferase [Clostridia bacterium]
MAELSVEIRRFKAGDAEQVSGLVKRTLRESNGRDYSKAYLERLEAGMGPESMIKRAENLHFYVAEAGERIVGCGGVGPYWDSKDEVWFSTVFVLPEFQGKGVGKLIVKTLENDGLSLHAKRIEIPASITARNFYIGLGYVSKDGAEKPDAEGLFRLEKRRATGEI